NCCRRKACAWPRGDRAANAKRASRAAAVAKSESARSSPVTAGATTITRIAGMAMAAIMATAGSRSPGWWRTSSMSFAASAFTRAALIILPHEREVCVLQRALARRDAANAGAGVDQRRDDGRDVFRTRQAHGQRRPPCFERDRSERAERGKPGLGGTLDLDRHAVTGLVGAKPVGSAGGHQARVEDRNPIRDLLGLRQVVSRDEDGAPF